MKTEEAHGWGMRVGGPRPYLAYFFSELKSRAIRECTQKYHRPVKVVMIPLSEYLKLKRKAGWE